jgi:hypothetical protein
MEINKSENLHLRNSTYITIILSVGDELLLADTEDHLQQNVTKLNKIIKLCYLSTLPNKTKVISM